MPAKGARVPGKGKLKAIEDAPGELCEGAVAYRRLHGMTASRLPSIDA